MSAIPEGKFITLPDGNKIHYHDIGEGQPVICLHGSGPGASAWSNFKTNKDYLAGAGFRVLLPDTLGYGLSSKPSDVDYSLEFMLSGVVGLIEQLGLKDVLVIGNSLGGIMTIKLAAEHPELISKVVLLAPGGLAGRERYAAMPGIRAMYECLLGPDGPTVQKIRETFEKQLFDPSGISEELLEERRAIALTQPKEVFTRMKVTPINSEVSKVRCPALIYWGVNDQFCPVDTHTELIPGIENSRAMIVNRCGHWVQVEHADLFNRTTVDFFKEA